MERLLPLIKAVLGSIWDKRFRKALHKSKDLGDRMSVAEAYRKGYSEAYWEGISDLARLLNQDEKELARILQGGNVTSTTHPWQPSGVVAEA